MALVSLGARAKESGSRLPVPARDALNGRGSVKNLPPMSADPQLDPAGEPLHYKIDKANNLRRCI